MARSGTISVSSVGRRQDSVYYCAACERKHRTDSGVAFLIPGCNVTFKGDTPYCPHSFCQAELTVHNVPDYSSAGRTATRLTLG